MVAPTIADVSMLQTSRIRIKPKQTFRFCAQSEILRTFPRTVIVARMIFVLGTFTILSVAINLKMVIIFQMVNISWEEIIARTVTIPY